MGVRSRSGSVPQKIKGRPRQVFRKPYSSSGPSRHNGFTAINDRDEMETAYAGCNEDSQDISNPNVSLREARRRTNRSIRITKSQHWQELQPQMSDVILDIEPVTAENNARFKICEGSNCRWESRICLISLARKYYIFLKFEFT